MKQLSPKSVWLFFVQSVIVFIILYLVFGFYIGFSIVAILLNTQDTSTLITMGLTINLIILIFVILLAFIWAKLSYNNYKYELREDGFRKESGVLWKKYVTIPYERIQNVDIYRGIFARLLGLSDLHIQTAGMSAISGKFGFGATSEGRLPGLTIQDAELLRDELVRRSKGKQGL